MVGDTDFVNNQPWVSIICPNTAELKRAGEQDRINGELVLTWEKISWFCIKESLRMELFVIPQSFLSEVM